MAYNAEINLVITKDDGTPFAAFKNQYSNLDLSQVVELEEFGHAVQSQLLAMGKQKLADKLNADKVKGPQGK